MNRKNCNKASPEPASVTQTKSTTSKPVRFTPSKKRLFLRLYRECGNVTLCARKIGVSKACIYKHIAKSPRFEKLFNEARGEAVDMMEAEAYRRAVRGFKKPVYQKGILVGYETIYDGRLLAILLRANNPEKFGDKTEVAITGDASFLDLLRKCNKDILSNNSNDKKD